MPPPDASADTRRAALIASSPITEAMIRKLVHTFYRKIRVDAELGPIFDRIISADAWPGHLERMCDFWSSVTLMSGRFKGSPVQAHIQVGDIRPDHFARWLHLFRQAASDVCPEEAAAIFAQKSQMIARSLQMAICLANVDLKSATECSVFDASRSDAGTADRLDAASHETTFANRRRTDDG